MSVKKVKAKPAFPGRSDVMGYDSGLSKVELFSILLYAQGRHTAVTAVEDAKKLLVELAKESTGG